jgi:hypothetical protein
MGFTGKMPSDLILRTQKGLGIEPVQVAILFEQSTRIELHIYPEHIGLDALYARIDFIDDEFGGLRRLTWVACATGTAIECFWKK